MNISRFLCKLPRIISKRFSSTESRHFDDKTSNNVHLTSNNVQLTLTNEKTSSLYVHWPYCARRCSYCNFNKYVKKKEGKRQNWFTIWSRKSFLFSLYHYWYNAVAYLLTIVNYELKDSASDNRMKACLVKELEYSIKYAGQEATLLKKFSLKSLTSFLSSII